MIARRSFLRSIILAAAAPNILVGVLGDRQRWKKPKTIWVPGEDYRYIEFIGPTNGGCGPYMSQAFMEIEGKGVLRVTDMSGDVRYYSRPFPTSKEIERNCSTFAWDSELEANHFAEAHSPLAFRT